MEVLLKRESWFGFVGFLYVECHLIGKVNRYRLYDIVRWHIIYLQRIIGRKWRIASCHYKLLCRSVVGSGLTVLT